MFDFDDAQLSSNKPDIPPQTDYISGFNNYYKGMKIETVIQVREENIIVKIPDTPNFIKGIVNLSGKKIPVMEMFEEMRLKKSDNNNKFIVVVNIAGTYLGFILYSLKGIK